MTGVSPDEHRSRCESDDDQRENTRNPQISDRVIADAIETVEGPQVVSLALRRDALRRRHACAD